MQQPQPTIQSADDNAVANAADPLIPASTPLPPQPAPAQTTQTSTACQTHSGQVITNTSRYDQSVTKRSQGLVAWEVLMDQDKREDLPTASTQYNRIITRLTANPPGFWHQNTPTRWV